MEQSVFLQQISQWTTDSCIIPDELPIISRQSQETPQLFGICRCWPRGNAICFLWISRHFLRTDDVAQILQ